MSHPQSSRARGVAAAAVLVAGFAAAPAVAAVTTVGDVSPVPPAGGGAVAGPFRVGNLSFGSMTISGGTPLASTGPAIVGDTATGIGNVTLTGFGSDWTLTTAGADMTIGASGTGNVTVANAAVMNVNDDTFVGSQANSSGQVVVSGIGSIWDSGDDAVIGIIGTGVFEVLNGGRAEIDSAVIGDSTLGNGRALVSGDLSRLRLTGLLIVGDAGLGRVSVADGGRVNVGSTAIVGNAVGSSGGVEVIGPGAVLEIAGNLGIGEFGNGQMVVSGGGRVVSNAPVGLSTIGRQIGGVGFVEVRGAGSEWITAIMEVGDSGDGTLRILDGGRVASGPVLIGDNGSARGEAVVDGPGSTWQINGELNVSDPGEAQLTLSNGGVARSTGLTRVAALGRLTLAGGRLEIDSATGVLNAGVIEGDGVIESTVVQNNAGGQVRTRAGDELRVTGPLNNSGTIDLAGGELSVSGLLSNNHRVTARDATLRGSAAGLDNNSGAQLAVTGGTVDVFGPVDNNLGAQVIVGGTSTAVFHGTFTNNGQFIVGPSASVLTLQSVSFAPGAGLEVGLLRDDPTPLFGHVSAAAAATVDGHVALDPQATFDPEYGESFQILSAAGGLTGAFDTVSGHMLSPTKYLAVTYAAGGVSVTAALPGDANLNGIVNIADFALLAANFNGPATWTSGNFDGDALTNIGDFSLLAANFNRSVAGFAIAPQARGNSAAVPEPAAIAVVALPFLPALRRRRR